MLPRLVRAAASVGSTFRASEKTRSAKGEILLLIPGVAQIDQRSGGLVRQVKRISVSRSQVSRQQRVRQSRIEMTTTDHAIGHPNRHGTQSMGLRNQRPG
ncbi:MAG: hypothetical protein Ct9H300mP1_23250 [Planctomycetaceae bacterium]|nr:MAG: hypothetical protein Ct9H300mP1_23250 [Planctomycetaceae bacterium]